MEVDFLYKILGIAAFIIGGANFVVALVAKTFWQLTFKRKEMEDEKKFKDLGDKIREMEVSMQDHESKNSITRHNFDVVTKSVYSRMDLMEESLTKAINNGFGNIKELFDEKIKNLNEKINEKKSL